MTQPQRKIAQRLLLLTLDSSIDDLALNRLVREVKGELSSVSPEIAADNFAVLALAFFKLEKFDDALAYASKGLALGTHLDLFRMAKGSSLVELGRALEAVPLFLEVVENKAPGDEDRVVALANLAEAFHLVGDSEACVAAMQQALEESDDAPALQFMLAGQAAEIGAYAEALRLLAHYFTLRRNSGVAREDLANPDFPTAEEQQILRRKRALSKLVTELIARGPSLIRSWDQAPRLDASRAPEDMLHVFDETAGSRARANRAVLGDA